MMSNNAKMLGLIGVVTIAMLLLGLTGLGFIPVSEYRFIDLLIVPVVIGSMIGTSSNRSFIPAIVFGTVWSLIVLGGRQMGIASIPDYAPFKSMVMSRIPTALVAALSYEMWRAYRPGCPKNVYRATVTAVVFRQVAAVAAGICTGFYDHYHLVVNHDFVITYLWQRAIPELAFSLLILRCWIGKLRELHLLNGIIIPPDARKPIDVIELVYKGLNKLFGLNLTRPKKPHEED
jgi:hypothetical protein